MVAIYRDKLNLDVMVINTYNNVLALKPDHTIHSLQKDADAIRGRTP